MSYAFTDIIKAARGLRAYLEIDIVDGMPYLGGTHAKLAGTLIGVKARKHEWSRKVVWALNGTKAWSDNRLRGAGIDPVTWRVMDVRRAAFAWQQLRTGFRKYSPRRQELLVNDPNNPTPDINVRLIFSTQRDNLIPKTEPVESRTLKHQIINYLRDKNHA